MAQANSSKPKPDEAGTVSAEEHDATVAQLKEAEKARTADQKRIKELEDALANAVTPPAPVVSPVLVAPLDPPKKMPAGFVHNAMTGQQWCGQCIQPEHPLDPTATSFVCEHGAWNGEPRILTGA
jgi:hypothetical protein